MDRVVLSPWSSVYEERAEEADFLMKAGLGAVKAKIAGEAKM